ncbi:hypothetical protein [Kluyvera georgiana]|uniref:hypothetical protein n=1 Tax=Kluyvera georgiana TaxID=73098 RepID=UPI003AF18F3E
MKTDREFWFRIGQQMNQVKQKKQANERERQHIAKAGESTQAINPEIAPRLRAALEAAKNGKASD